MITSATAAPAAPPTPGAGGRAALDALGDRTRRSILELLAAGPMAVGVMAERLPISRPAVSQHLRVLREAELVVEQAAGTRRLYRINPKGLAAVRDYLDRFWATALDNFAALAAEEARPCPDEIEPKEQ